MARAASEVKAFFRRCPARIVGITGEGADQQAVCTLVARILGEAGRRVWRSSSRPTLEALLPDIRAIDLVVIELSTEQLADLDTSPHLAVGMAMSSEQAALMAAKGNLFWHQRSDDIALYDGSNSYARQLAALSPGRQVAYMQAPGVRLDRDTVRAGETGIVRLGPSVSASTARIICAATAIVYELVGLKLIPMQRGIGWYVETMGEGV